MLKQVLCWIIAITASLMTVGLTPKPALANPVQTDNVQAQLVSEVQTIQPGTPFWVGLNFKINPGWHTYWRNPGDSGMQTKIDWKLPNGFQVGEILYPYPQRLPVGSFMNFGYKKEVTLLSQITPPANLVTTNPIQLEAKADWLVCKEDCIPEEGVFKLTLPVQSDTPAFNTQWKPVFEKTRSALPIPSPWAVAANMSEEELVLRVKTPQLQASQIKEVAFFPDKDGVITNAAPQEASFDANGLTLKLQRGNLSDFEEVNGVLVISEALEKQTVTQSFTIQAPLNSQIQTTAANQADTLPIWQVMFLALLGGVVLNLMPCVFPVLSLKAFHIVRISQSSQQQVRLGAIAFGAGVLTSFTVVAGALLILRGLGEQVGWGFQLQSPVFVTLMAYLMFAVGLSLSGVFVFGASLMGIGQGLAARSGYMGEFFSGVFATVVATPCTAPFMATAIGVALTQTPLVAIAIFEMLGLGLALPYIVICFTPGLQKILPKPGAWMETFQQFLAFPMYAATAWLVWVLTQQAGTGGLAGALTGLILISFAAWLHQKTRLISRWGQRLGTVVALVILGLSLSLAQLATPDSAPIAQGTNQQGIWQPYNEARLTELRSSGTPVFVNFSASWCISCLVNERVVLSQPEIIAAFESKGVALLKADWTTRNPAITKALESFGRSGVPLYLLYPKLAKSSEPIILPQKLSKSDIIRAVESL
jgi:thiol:disulfide interchange protein